VLSFTEESSQTNKISDVALPQLSPAVKLEAVAENPTLKRKRGELAVGPCAAHFALVAA
jgi:hypothetical protein